MQTTSYLPYFISWVVVSGMIFAFFNQQSGMINEVLLKLEIIKQPLPITTDPQYFWPMLIISDIWKLTGWWSILFLASIASIDKQIYEAAVVDGAGRLRRIWHITLPGMKSTFSIVLILSVANLLGGGLGGSNFEQAYLLGNPINYSKSNILQIHTLKMGLGSGRYSYASAVGLFSSVISLLLLLGSNYIVKKSTGKGIA